MKLYTEEQIRKAINDSSLYSYVNGEFLFKNSEDDIVNSLTPIELPSDEEIKKESDEFELNSRVSLGMHISFEQGAKWMRELLFNIIIIIRQTMTIIKSKNVCKDNDIFLLHIGFKHYDLGFQVHNWGLRIMLIWYHLCFHKKFHKK